MIWHGKKIDNVATQIVSELDWKLCDALYRRLWIDYVKQDIESHLNEDLGNDYTDDEIQVMAEHYVYDGEYDSNMTYWDNIENLQEFIIK